MTAALVLLYAQPLTRMAQLSTDDVQQEDGKALVRLGEPRRLSRSRSPGCC
ncbi:hypothetical protein [Streptomyces syringium]|uniref:hypothetical protein n=1 Tax=Streptomyces syringium TaxID=76729 RepID=UPI003451864C